MVIKLGVRFNPFKAVVIYSVAAKGSFVSGISEVLKKRREELLADYSQLVKELVMCGATEEELIAHLKEAENND